MKIGLLFDGASALGASPDVLILDTLEAIERVLTAEGNQVMRISAHTDARWIERVRKAKRVCWFRRKMRRKRRSSPVCR